MQEAKDQGLTQVSGEAVFKLYDTYGFPVDLVEDAAREEGLTLDRHGYQQAMDEQRERARKTAKFTQATSRADLLKAIEQFPVTRFVGYAQEEAQGQLLAMVKGECLVSEAQQGEDVEFLLDVTPFYAEGGGQVGDQIGRAHV